MTHSSVMWKQRVPNKVLVGVVHCFNRPTSGSCCTTKTLRRTTRNSTTDTSTPKRSTMSWTPTKHDRNRGGLRRSLDHKNYLSLPNKPHHDPKQQQQHASSNYVGGLLTFVLAAVGGVGSAYLMSSA